MPCLPTYDNIRFDSIDKLKSYIINQTKVKSISKAQGKTVSLNLEKKSK
jgi:hypothetical protein